MAASSQATGKEKASWDDVNTEIFLNALIAEIDAGNRQGGHYTKAAWNTIRAKFNAESGCNFSQGQLKNKLDNLKKDFQLWEKLRCEESGLGYDTTTGRITADQVWWRQKIQERPEYKRFKTHGPLHLELQEKVFRGIVATGYLLYVPGREPPIENHPVDDETADSEDVHEEENGNANVDNGGTQATTNVGTSGKSTQNTVRQKRRRGCSSSKGPSLVDVNKGILDYIHVCKEKESATSVWGVENPDTISYTDALQMLRSLPWIQDSILHFGIAAKHLADPTNRVAFSQIVDLGEAFVKSWLDQLVRNP